MREIILSTLTGAGVGIVFALFKLPAPVPPMFAGVAGIIGVWLGYVLVSRFLL
jgi:XapX domain-containing protein